MLSKLFLSFKVQTLMLELLFIPTIIGVINELLKVSSFLCQPFRFIRCWDAKLFQEVYRITVGLGGLGSASELCVWYILALRYVCVVCMCVCNWSINSMFLCLFQVWNPCECR